MSSQYKGTEIEVIDEKEYIKTFDISKEDLVEPSEDLATLSVEILKDFETRSDFSSLGFSFTSDSFPKEPSIDQFSQFFSELDKCIRMKENTIKKIPEILLVPLTERLLQVILPNASCKQSVLSILSYLSVNRLTSEKTALLFQFNTMTILMAYAAFSCESSVLMLTFLSAILRKRREHELLHKRTEKHKSRSRSGSFRGSIGDSLPLHDHPCDIGVSSFTILPPIPFYDETVGLLFTLWRKHSSDPRICLFFLDIIHHACKTDISLHRFYNHGLASLLKETAMEHSKRIEIVRRVISVAEAGIRQFDVKLKLLQEGYVQLCESALMSFATHQPLALAACRLLVVLCYVGYRLETGEGIRLPWRLRLDVIGEVIIQHRRSLAGCAASFIMFVLEDKDPSRLRRDIFYSFESCVFHDFEKYHIHVASFSQHTQYENHRYLVKTDIPKRLRKYYVKPSQMKFGEKLVMLLYRRDSNPKKICAVCHGHRNTDVYQMVVTWRLEFSKIGYTLNVNPTLFKP
ncbi:hypothetical protein ADUPG1_006677 [Aduncisulcus paluster]|uniref:Uncharacterized protein n=1 Tax=Aduncisulcus paluster TaxID=2918883 RepID=A0ABQ5KNP7_9EUKA|nr:hypothetical protein ADUPG1_006677 [Aduncisulcus paluster]